MTDTLSALAQNVKSGRLTYLGRDKLLRLEQSMEEVVAKGVEGDFIEFGVALGGTAILAAAKATSTGRRFAGFDVFGMIPPPESEKDDAKSKKRYEVIKGGGSVGIGNDTYYGYRDDLYGDVVRSFGKFDLDVDGTKIALVKGLFEDTWPTHACEKIAFAHVDCDWYDPVKYCVAVTAAKMDVGGIMVIDDYHDYSGCRKAIDEFLVEQPSFQAVPGRNLILKRVGP